MNSSTAVVLLIVLLGGPLALTAIERNLEVFSLAVGVCAVTVAGGWSRALLLAVARAPLAITVAVIVAGLGFARLRLVLERGFAWLRRVMSRPLLTAVTIVVIGLAASLLTAVVAALMLVEAAGMLRLGPPARNNVVVAGCFAIGFGSALTPAGGPFSAIVVQGLGLHFFDLCTALGAWVVPGVLVLGALGAWFARGGYDLIAEETPVRERVSDVLVQASRIFAFVAGLALIGAAYAPLAAQLVPRLAPGLVFWGNTASAALDNATLAALETHGTTLAHLRPGLLSMIISGGMLIPGNLPNIVCAGILRIRSAEWAQVGVPLGLALLGTCFALLILGGA